MKPMASSGHAIHRARYWVQSSPLDGMAPGRRLVVAAP